MTDAANDTERLLGSTALPLDRLQEPMEAIALGSEPNSGRFCPHCFARLETSQPARHPSSVHSCPICGGAEAESAPFDHVPDEVLALYMAKRRREGIIVNAFAFGGIFVSLILSALLWFIVPPNLWRLASFAMLAFGSYYFARLFGYQLGVPIGAESGRRLRDRRWREFELRRAGEHYGR